MIARAAQRLSTLAVQLAPPARAMSASASASAPMPTFEVSPAPADPLGKGKHVATAAFLCIGDEVLNGKTRDSNSNFAAKLLFDLGIELKRIEVIADDEDEIVEAARRMVDRYDMVLTSGGIGPTHDDITYSSLAKAFDDAGKLEYHDETLRRMNEMGKRRWNMDQQTEEQQTARKRMALFPVGSEALFVAPDLWVLFEQLLTAYCSGYVPLPPTSAKPYRHLVHTEMPESSIAPFLTSLAERTKAEGIRVGSYPHFKQGVDVSLIGRDLERLKILGEEVCKELKGEVLAVGKLGEEEKTKT